MRRVELVFYRANLQGVKDVTELHRQDAENLLERLGEDHNNAWVWLNMAQSEQEERSTEAWAACSELTESVNILAELITELKRCRLVGEKRNAQPLYLALTSWLLEKNVDAHFRQTTLYPGLAKELFQ